MKQLIYIITLSILSCLMPLNAMAVTDKEMEEARTIATKAYLRYANDLSGYLDEIHPKTMAALEKSLKQKEKENLKAFKAIPVPSDYRSWDKQKLVDYWGVKAFAAKGLLEKGRIGRSRARKNINAMSIAAPTATPAPKETKDNKESKSIAEAPKGDNNASPAVAEDKTAASTLQTEPTAEADTTAAEADTTAAEAISKANAALDAMAALEEDPQIKKADNHTWVYIIILCILVAVVVALVIFASNVMKRNEEGIAVTTSGPDSLPKNADADKMREKFAATLAAKNEEVKTLSAKVDSLNSQNATLKSSLEKLTAECASLRSRLAESNHKLSEMHTALSAISNAAKANVAPAEPAPAAPAPTPAPAPAPERPVEAPQPPKAQNPLRTIYLGRANAKGIFIRADRTLNLGNSIYRLDTNDGYAGSFRVANDPTVWEMALLTPRESLSGACAIADIDNTSGMTRIVNDSAGTAVFEGGCWKVIRKAKVHFE